VPAMPRRRTATRADLQARHLYLHIVDHGWPDEQQLEFVGRRCREHYQEQRGKLTLFGEILGYVYRPRRGVYRSFSIDGRIVDDAKDL
jgi:hypothetical protein